MITIQLRRVRGRVHASSYDNKWRKVPEYLGHLDSVKVDLRSPCEKMPYLGMDESCKLSRRYCLIYSMFQTYFFLSSDEFVVSESQATLQSNSIWGMLRGLESFSQLLYVAVDARSVVYPLTPFNSLSN